MATPLEVLEGTPRLTLSQQRPRCQVAIPATLSPRRAHPNLLELSILCYFPNTWRKFLTILFQITSSGGPPVPISHFANRGPIYVMFWIPPKLGLADKKEPAHAGYPRNPFVHARTSVDGYHRKRFALVMRSVTRGFDVCTEN